MILKSRFISPLLFLSFFKIVFNNYKVVAKVLYLYELKQQVISNMTDIQLKQLKDNLWHSADLLRQGAHLAANKFGQPILGLVFLRYADILFKQHKALWELPCWWSHHFFLTFVMPLGGVIPRVKGSSSPQENLDIF